MTGTRICKVCGKEYKYCRTALSVGNVFRWQDVACSPEHAAIYFAQIEASRSSNNVEPQVSENDDDTEGYDAIDDEDDDWLDDDDEYLTTDI